MIISAKMIKKPRKHRLCEKCGCTINGKQLRLYGAAFTNDPPYVIHIHPYACNHAPSPLDVKEITQKLDSICHLRLYNSVFPNKNRTEKR